MSKNVSTKNITINGTRKIKLQLAGTIFAVKASKSVQN